MQYLFFGSVAANFATKNSDIDILVASEYSTEEEIKRKAEEFYGRTGARIQVSHTRPQTLKEVLDGQKNT